MAGLRYISSNISSRHVTEHAYIHLRFLHIKHIKDGAIAAFSEKHTTDTEFAHQTLQETQALHRDRFRFCS